MRQLYPLSAIVGQDDLITALTVCAVSPSVGGLLIRGDKGSAKSTAARALSEVLAPIERQEGCRYNCEPGLPAAVCDICHDSEKQSITRQNVPFVNLPLGVSEERLIGTLDLDKMLSHSKKSFQPGLLASSHRGILYIDEVNLLADHLVDLLLDAAAMGVCVVERDGFSVSHPSRITLIGTMNPEEGELRPQLLDRFGLMVDVKAPSDPEVRADVVRKRMSFDKAPEKFRKDFEAAQTNLQARIARAKEIIARVEISDPMLLCASTICAEMGIASLRADIVMGQVARTLASLDGREHVNLEDLRQAAKLTLPHRKRTKPGERCGIDQEKLEELLSKPETGSSTSPSNKNEAETSSKKEPGQDPGKEQRQAPPKPQEPPLNSPPQGDNQQESEGGAQTEATRFAIAPLKTEISLAVKDLGGTASTSDGSHTMRAIGKRGQVVREKPAASPNELAATATVRHSLLRTGGKLEITRRDLHQRERLAKQSNLVIFVVDCSGSMAARKRMEMVKGAIDQLFANAYQERDKVAVITFAGQRAELSLPPTRSIDEAHRLLGEIETGGRTPLSSALSLTNSLLLNLQDRDAPLVVLLTDGKANVAENEKLDPWQEVIAEARQIKDYAIANLVIDTEVGFVRLGKAGELAQLTGGEYVLLDKLTAENIALVVNRYLRKS